MKKYSWSKELRRRASAYQYWKKGLKLLQYANHQDEGLQVMREIVELEDSEADLSETQIKEKNLGARKALRQAQHESLKFRQLDFEKDMIADLTGQRSAESKKKVRILKAILRAERRIVLNVLIEFFGQGLVDRYPRYS